jgi:hypothetical protein
MDHVGTMDHVGSGLRPMRETFDEVSPTAQRITALIKVRCVVVDTGYASLMTTNVINDGFHDVRLC